MGSLAAGIIGGAYCAVRACDNVHLFVDDNNAFSEKNKTTRRSSILFCTVAGAAIGATAGYHAKKVFLFGVLPVAGIYTAIGGYNVAVGCCKKLSEKYHKMYDEMCYNCNKKHDSVKRNY